MEMTSFCIVARGLAILWNKNWVSRSFQIYHSIVSQSECNQKDKHKDIPFSKVIMNTAELANNLG